MTSGPRRIAIVGAGPKGLYCLERLALELHARDSADCEAVQVHIFEPHTTPGAGPVYEPSQPHFLRLNFANQNIDAWSRDWPNPEVTGPTFLQFLQGEHPKYAHPDGYAPRALVGEYLNRAFTDIVAALREVATVEIQRTRVTSVAQTDEQFQITTPDGSFVCDEVMIATGHASRRSATADPSDGRSLGPYPIDAPGGVADIASGSTVAVRGMGLTAIDVALALTEGRGGMFEWPNGARAPAVYRNAGSADGAILPFSRTGRPMVPKDHPHFGPDSSVIDQVRERFGPAVEALETLERRGGLDVFGALEQILVQASAVALELSTPSTNTAPEIWDHLATLKSREPLPAGQVLHELRRGVDIAYGRCAPGVEWALGAAWKALYGALVDLFANRCLDGAWPDFAALAIEMERVAFGPPAENAARFLALAEAGVIDLSMAPGAERIDGDDGPMLRAAGRTRGIDAFVDAVLAPPGAAPDGSPLVASLIEGGLARPMPDAPGIEVRSDGTCVGRDGAATVGLGAVGRPTEGCILGNDTLSRTLHDTPAQWACSAVRRLATRKEPVLA